MKESRTPSMLQRLPVILAVTAASYGLPLQSQAHRVDQARQSQSSTSSQGGKPAAALQRAL